MEKLNIDNHENLRKYLDVAGYSSWSNEQIEEMYNDTAANLFNNGPRVVQISYVRSTVNAILKLIEHNIFK